LPISENFEEFGAVARAPRPAARAFVAMFLAVAGAVPLAVLAAVPAVKVACRARWVTVPANTRTSARTWWSWTCQVGLRGALG
jgi:hypothetical protein